MSYPYVGKHQPARYRFNNSIDLMVKNANILPIVIVRNFWTWAASMCRNNYAAIWFHVTGPEGHCPNLIPNHIEHEWFHKSWEEVERYYHGNQLRTRNVMFKANFSLDDRTLPVNVRYKTQVIRYPSLVHFWQDWYDEYYDAEFPRLMLRLEDLVFRPYETLKKVCDCVDGKFASREHFQVRVEGSKSWQMGHSSRQTDLMRAFHNHLRSNRTAGMTAADVWFAKAVLRDSKANIFFDYKSP